MLAQDVTQILVLPSQEDGGKKLDVLRYAIYPITLELIVISVSNVQFDAVVVMIRLHNEIKHFYECMMATPDERLARQNLVDRITSVVTGLWSGAKVIFCIL